MQTCRDCVVEFANWRPSMGAGVTSTHTHASKIFDARGRRWNGLVSDLDLEKIFDGQTAYLETQRMGHGVPTSHVARSTFGEGSVAHAVGEARAIALSFLNDA